MNMATHRCRDLAIHKYMGTIIHPHTWIWQYTQIRGYGNTQIHEYDNTLIIGMTTHKYMNMAIYTHTSIHSALI